MSERNGIYWTNEKRKLSQLKPWPRNPRQIKQDQAKRLGESFDQFGQVETLAIGPDGEIYNGHQRLNVLMVEHGADYEVDVRVASRPLSEKEREKLTVYLHKGAAGEWDFDILANEFELDDLLDWGFDKKELDLDLWLPEPPEDPGAQMDRAEELREKWGVESGQLWQLGEHRLICGDCTDRAVVERVMGGEKAAFCFTDPPYNVGIDYGETTDDNQSFDDFGRWCGLWLAHVPKKHLMTVGIKRMLWWREIAGDPTWIIAWVKRNGQGNTKLGGTNKWDSILAYNVEPDGGIDIVEINNDYSENIKTLGGHPTAKPVELWELIMRRFCFDNEIVYDPFLGSGTTLIACERLGRKCRAIEISPAYCAVAIQRWVDMTGGEPVLLYNEEQQDG
ncbi:MAG: Chromosome partitioning protein parB / Adenine-specific methyltransferase [Candidatus Gottesmanbacteria bacterium GW2011_GWB1_49_7]|uniref:Methyltransferase n=1 Tax=Candidatus Gottesmanbacteria bacterium GW2011_GWB1_49_7 TaxID=1618448 RepID=A0A0G1W3V2_9BACT|nr:MAG: Chromosome partitioning protein parB / Adenine-specific methyltransferase [Candidatus Gottesmanbacteria bacterium GW2011_GWB1_49_7]